MFVCQVPAENGYAPRGAWAYRTPGLGRRSRALYERIPI